MQPSLELRMVNDETKEIESRMINRPKSFSSFQEVFRFAPPLKFDLNWQILKFLIAWYMQLWIVVLVCLKTSCLYYIVNFSTLWKFVLTHSLPGTLLRPKYSYWLGPYCICTGIYILYSMGCNAMIGPARKIGPVLNVLVIW